MFTGLVETSGLLVSLELLPISPRPNTIQSLDPQEIGRRLTIAVPEWFLTSLGDSIAVNGCCLTDLGNYDKPFEKPFEKPFDKPSEKPKSVSDDLTKADSLSRFVRFDVSPESLSKTNLSKLQKGSLVHLERALLPTTRLGGHMVLGHVDGKGIVNEVVPKDGFWYLSIKISKELSRYVVSKGSLAIDGVSLTVNRIVDEKDFSSVEFMLIPHTWQLTRFSQVAVGDEINIEVDILAKHLERLHQRS